MILSRNTPTLARSNSAVSRDSAATGAPSRSAAVRDVAPQVATPSTTITRIGSVSTIGAQSGSALIIVLNNTATATKEYIMGDPYGMVAARTGKTYLAPTSVGGSAAMVTPWKSSTQQGFSFRGLQIKTSSNAAQFANPVMLEQANFDLSGGSVPINILGGQSPDFLNPLILKFEFESNVVLDSRQAMTLTVLAGEQVTLFFYVDAFGF